MNFFVLCFSYNHNILLYILFISLLAVLRLERVQHPQKAGITPLLSYGDRLWDYSISYPVGSKDSFLCSKRGQSVKVH